MQVGGSLIELRSRKSHSLSSVDMQDDDQEARKFAAPLLLLSVDDEALLLAQTRLFSLHRTQKSMLAESATGPHLRSSVRRRRPRALSSRCFATFIRLGDIGRRLGLRTVTWATVNVEQYSGSSIFTWPLRPPCRR